MGLKLPSQINGNNAGSGFSTILKPWELVGLAVVENSSGKTQGQDNNK